MDVELHTSYGSLVGTPMAVMQRYGHRAEWIAGPSTFIQASDVFGPWVSVLTNTTAIVVWVGPSSSYTLRAAVATLSDDGTVVSIGTILDVQTQTTNPTVVAMDSTHAMVVYGDRATNFGAARVLTISGTNVVAGAENVWDSTSEYPGYYGWCPIAKLDATNAIVINTAYSPSGVRVRVLTMSGTSISAGPKTTLYSSSYINQSLNIAALSSTSAIALYSNPNTPWDLWAVGLSISGTTVTAGTAVQLSVTSDGGDTGELGICAMDGTNAIATFTKINTTYYDWYAANLTLSGTTVTVNTPTKVNLTPQFYYPYQTVCAVSSVVAINVCWRYQTDGKFAKLSLVGGNTVFAENQAIFDYNFYTKWNCCSAFDDRHVIVASRNESAGFPSEPQGIVLHVIHR